MKRINKAHLFNVIILIIIFISFCITIKIDNDSRLPENINIDYYMNSLPYIYIILVFLVMLILFNFYKCIKDNKK
ncbi:formate hydrogenlyase subunit 3/multisubunit Na+/H+ antiporter MnhD subunit [Clostridium moniliforme]|uniref:Formate hydrogenlyase subunit 3/multisubunit Na+/H+ antiporter MnhD subunit n=1 Tax=Clostridium moniliforme TaxID=39489 RepID=A0ABS4EZV7_9CLOT|nr:hypothetical protein [Clostridium moniliforme]MBP1889525.1 formate hydrogenlyase subunit 3/multisubunit Na+/H+ antiporter MnhD subunit [Clostridium moniliforme]